MRLAPLLVVFACGSAGCLPFVTPPARLRGTLGAGLGNASDGRGFAQGRSASVGQFEATVAPFGFVPQAIHRSFDVGAGWAYDDRFDGAGPALHGPVLAASWFPAVAKLGPDAAARLELLSRAQVLFLEGRDEVGWGATLGVGGEVAGVAVGPLESHSRDGFVFALGVGEWGFGGDLSVSRRSVGAADYWSFQAGLALRLPLMVGVVCCYLPKTSSADDEPRAAATATTAPTAPPVRRPAEPRRSRRLPGEPVE